MKLLDSEKSRVADWPAHRRSLPSGGTGVSPLPMNHMRRRWWIFPGRLCTCGLIWPCVDLELQRVRDRYPGQFMSWERWNGPTRPLPVQPSSYRAGQVGTGTARDSE